MTACNGPWPSEAQAREEIVRVCRLLWERSYVAATDGNVSVRVGPDRLLATPSGLSKGFLQEDQLVLTDLNGASVSEGPSALRPSSELRMHCAVYRERPDVLAVVHAHPPMATACTVAGVSLMQPVLPEVLVTLGGIPTARYARPSSAEGAVVIRELIREHDAVLLDHHGTLTVGRSAFEAYLKLEKVENAALVLLAAGQLGGVRDLPPEEAEELLASYRRRSGSHLAHDGGA
jgi:L-fuculose-phosphate aldolase